MSIKQICKDCTPPLLWRMVRRLRPAPNTLISFSGDYPDWQSACAASIGYDSGAIFARVREAARKVRDGEALWERDSVCFQHEEYNHHLLTCLLHTAARDGGRLHVLDFGGALGSTYMQHKTLLRHVPELTWSVVEQAHVVMCGQQDFSDGHLDFFENAEAAFAVRPVNLVLLSSVLQYLETPYALLRKLLMFGPLGVYVGRTPLAECGERLTVQNVPESIYKASYPCWFLDKVKLAECFGRDYILTPWQPSPVDPAFFQNLYAYKNT